MTCHCEQFSSQKGSWQKSRRHHRPYHHHHHHPNGILPQCRWYAVNGNGYSRNRAIAFISNGQWVIGRPGIIDCRCQLWLLHNLMWHILFLVCFFFFFIFVWINIIELQSFHIWLMSKRTQFAMPIVDNSDDITSHNHVKYDVTVRFSCWNWFVERAPGRFE